MSDTPLDIFPPVVLKTTHDLSQFQSGEPALDGWLRQRALSNLELGASRTYVVCPVGSEVAVGFYSLSMGQVLALDVPGSMRRNMPNNIPAVILGRLAVDEKWQGKGIARGLLADVIKRSLRASSEIATRLVIVHAISTRAEMFYLHHGFMRLPVETSTLAFDLVKYAKVKVALSS
jgi:GNAT superfamily N-acetyltransferase